MSHPDDVGRIVIIDGSLSQKRTTRTVYVTIEMLVANGTWSASMALVGAQIVTAGGALLSGWEMKSTLLATLVVGICGVALRGAQAWITAYRWRKVMTDE
jgi:hypothetical protein